MQARELSPQEVSRIKRLPALLDSARRKVAALECEARRYGFTDLLQAKGEP
ncbi:hypothetical protein [Novosphingobium sp. BW1]|uniref:hypothetical protein n=1 Tax=Novosphingobium sp. BW1 TaxID=2592621 RepID=UPI001293EBD6|nr:hypothetical protein [Novosphingobium sp. BW1]